MENISSYVPPQILDDMDEDVIRSRMLESLPSNIDKTVGGFASDMVFPAAIEKADMLIVLNEIVKIFFPEWSYDLYLDMHARRESLTRRSATAAVGIVTVSGVSGTVIPEGFVFSTAATAIASNVEFKTISEATIPDSGALNITVECTQTGTVGNVPENSVTLMASPLAGIESATNPAPITGGTESESDDDLRTRIMEVDRQGEESFVGCDADYVRWAKEVDGVGTATPLPEWDGPGTVKLIITDLNGQPANTALLEAVYEHIVAEGDRSASRKSPIGATLTVGTSKAVDIDITAYVALEDDADIDAVKTAYEARLINYFKEAKAESAVRHTRIGSVLSETDGILDYENLLLNGSTANIPIADDEYPSVKSITFVEANQHVKKG